MFIVKFHLASVWGGEKTALVMGGGIAGLLASRVLADHFERVILVEKDRLADGPAHRNGTPQSHQAHLLLSKVYRVITHLFPKIEAELLALGAQKIDFSKDARIHVPGGWCNNFSLGIFTLACSRNLLEFAIRKEIAREYPAVKFVEGTAAGLIANDDRSCVLGISTDNSGPLLADLVVDATGRNTKTPVWLYELGLGRPEEMQISAFFAYATRRLRMPSGFCPDWKAMVILGNAPSNPRMGFLYRIENDEWMLALQGNGKTHPPADEHGFMDFARKLEDDAIYDIASRAEPASQIYGYRGKGSRRFLYEKMKNWPDRLVCIGDSVAAINPFYAQGITVAALNALALGDFMRSKSLRKGSATLQKRLAKVNLLPWTMAATEDLRWPTTEGGNAGFAMRLKQKFADHVMLLVQKDPAAMRSFLDVTHMLESPSTLFHPKLLSSVMLSILMQRKPLTRSSSSSRSLPQVPLSSQEPARRPASRPS